MHGWFTRCERNRVLRADEKGQTVAVVTDEDGVKLLAANQCSKVLERASVMFLVD
jgi:hypothetical protein